MTIGGWITLILSVGSVTSLLGWCIYKVLTSPTGRRELGHIEPVHDDQLNDR